MNKHIFMPGDFVYCGAFGHGHVTRILDGGNMFVKFHGGEGQEYFYYAGGTWREVTEDEQYDLVKASRAVNRVMAIVDRLAWGLIGGAMTIIYIYSPWSAW